MPSFEEHLEKINKSLWGDVVFSTGVKYSPFNQKYAIIINKVLIYALRLVIEVDERCGDEPEYWKISDFITLNGALEHKDKLINDFEKYRNDYKSMHPYAGYYLEIPDAAHTNPDNYLIPGDFILVERVGNFVKYNHAGIYAGKSQVIHITVPETCSGDGKFKDEARVLKTNWDKFYGNKQAKITVFLKLYKRKSHKEILEAAESLVGTREGEYHFLKRNCQSFAAYCQNGFDFSPEVYEVFENVCFISRKYMPKKVNFFPQNKILINLVRMLIR